MVCKQIMVCKPYSVNRPWFVSHIVSVSNTKLYCYSMQKLKECDGCVPIKFNSKLNSLSLQHVTEKIALFSPHRSYNRQQAKSGPQASLPSLIFSNEVTLRAEEQEQVCLDIPEADTTSQTFHMKVCLSHYQLKYTLILMNYFQQIFMSALMKNIQLLHYITFLVNF